jgi:hypothetical protein
LHHVASHFRFTFACFASFCFFLRSFRLRFNPLFCFQMKQFLLRYFICFSSELKRVAYHNQSISRAADPWIFHCLDDVTIILLLDGSFLAPSTLSWLTSHSRIAFVSSLLQAFKCRNLFNEKLFYSSVQNGLLAIKMPLPCLVFRKVGCCVKC